MRVGTKSVLFGVHQFLWHPLTIALAWRRLYRRGPNWVEWVCIFCHDLGYWGKSNMDGPEGRSHPVTGAILVRKIVTPFSGPEAGHQAGMLTYLHSREVSRHWGLAPSKLCWADKLCVTFDPNWFYLFRARLSGEIHEFKKNAESQIGKVSDECWLNWYRNKVRNLPEIIQLIAKNDREDYCRSGARSDTNN